jgi:hypothetical protein
LAATKGEIIMTEILSPKLVIQFKDELYDQIGLLEPDDFAGSSFGIYFKYKDRSFIYGIRDRHEKLNISNLSKRIVVLDERVYEPPRHELEINDNQVKVVEVMNRYLNDRCLLSEILTINNIDVEYCIDNNFLGFLILVHDLYLKNCIIDAADHNFYEIV